MRKINRKSKSEIRRTNHEKISFCFDDACIVYGDFVFRIYADQNNQPAAYSPENVPYHPDYFAPVSLGGVTTLCIGYFGCLLI